MAFPCVCLPAAVVVLCLNKCVYSHICLSRLQFRAINQWRRQDLKFGDGCSPSPPFPSPSSFHSLPVLYPMACSVPPIPSVTFPLPSSIPSCLSFPSYLPLPLPPHPSPLPFPILSPSPTLPRSGPLKSS